MVPLALCEVRASFYVSDDLCGQLTLPLDVPVNRVHQSTLLLELSRGTNLPPHHPQPCIFCGLRTAGLPHSKQRTQRSTQLLLIAGISNLLCSKRVADQ